MHKILTLLLFSQLGITIFSQEKPEKTGEDFEHIVSLQSGLNFTTGIALAYLEDTYDYSGEITSTNSSPGLTLNWDYRAVGRLSVNGFISYNKVKVVHKTNSNFYAEEGLTDQNITGITWGSRFALNLLYKKSFRSHLYIGAGLYVCLWSAKPDRTYKQIVNGNAGAKLGLPFFVGYRYFFTEHFGATVELSSYWNNVASAGISYRF